MSSSAVLAVSNSAPRSGRNYQMEIDALLSQSEENRKAAAEIDTGIAILTTEARIAQAADLAIQRGGDAAEVARARIA